VPLVRASAGGGAGAEGEKILLRGLPPGMVESAPGAGTQGGVLCDGMRLLRERI